jgi:predicted phosphodiesterase
MKRFYKFSFDFLFSALILNVIINLTSITFAGELKRGPYLQNQTETGVTIMWATSDTGSVGEVEIDGIGVFETISQNDHQSITRHKTRITGLQGNTDYSYRIRTDDEIQSEWISFHTNKSKGESFRFTIIGDAGDYEDQTHQHNVAIQMLRVMPDFYLHTGDLVLHDYSSNDFDYNTEKHFAVYQMLNQSRPHYPVRGNHEGGYPPAEFRKDFDFPETTAPLPEVYDFVYSDMWIASFSTGGPSGCADFDSIRASYQKGGWQYNWLEEQLKTVAKDYTWKLVMCHRPSYNASKRYSTFMASTEQITELCEDYGVDFIAYGHVHALQRSRPMYRGKVDNIKGIIHFDCSGGGVRNIAGSGQNEYPWTDFVCGDKWGFLRVDVTFDDEQSTCILTFIDEHGKVINSQTGSSGIWGKTKNVVNHNVQDKSDIE